MRALDRKAVDNKQARAPTQGEDTLVIEAENPVAGTFVRRAPDESRLDDAVERGEMVRGHERIERVGQQASQRETCRDFRPPVFLRKARPCGVEIGETEIRREPVDHAGRPLEDRRIETGDLFGAGGRHGVRHRQDFGTRCMRAPGMLSRWTKRLEFPKGIRVGWLTAPCTMMPRLDFHFAAAFAAP